MKKTISGDIFQRSRYHMVDTQLVGRGITSIKVLEATRNVPRHLFVPHQLWDQAYTDSPLPIGMGQTISQPFIVAYMTQAANLQPSDKVLEIGTGCGYAAAIASTVSSEVYTVETIKELVQIAQPRLTELGYHNVHCFHSDGSVGLPSHAPFDVIIVTAGAPTLPKFLIEQLSPNGRMIIPVSKGSHEELLCVKKNEQDNITTEHLMDVRFVPLIGKEGWSEY
jgi:protein-L-isoaspartate(D-aspartate) O-methyltransferase